MEAKYKIGHVFENGYEIVSIEMKPIYTMRKKVTLRKDLSNKQFAGKKGYYYMNSDDGHKWFTFLNDDKIHRISEMDIQY